MFETLLKYIPGRQTPAKAGVLAIEAPSVAAVKAVDEAIAKVTQGMQAKATPGLGTKVDLQGPPNPNVRGGKPIAVVGFSTSAKPDSSTALSETDMGVASLDVTSLRYTASNTKDLVRKASKVSPELSAAITSYIRTAITQGYTAMAYNLDRTFNREATLAAAQVLTSFDVLQDYTIGFDDSPSMRSLSESFARELLTNGALCGELVLNQLRLPDRIVGIPTSQLKWYPTKDGKRKYPKQVISGNEIDLNFPTIFYVSLDQDLLTAYSDSPIQAAMAGVMFSEEFMNDIRRIVRKVVHPRMVVTVDEEKLRKTIPPQYAADPDKTEEYITAVFAALESKVSDLQPEQALTIFDMFAIEVVDHGNTNLSNEYEVMMKLANAKLSAGTKALPTVLGMANGSSNVASTEAVMFVKYVEGTVWSKLNEFYSKVLTLAVRLMGHDVYVDFKYNPINLRPDEELESFRAMKQSRFLQLLSLGLITDERCSVELTGELPPAGYTPVMGTGFWPNTSTDPAGTGYNGASNDGSTLNKDLKPSTPTNPGRGGNNKADVVPLRGGL